MLRCDSRCPFLTSGTELRSFHHQPRASPSHPATRAERGLSPWLGFLGVSSLCFPPCASREKRRGAQRDPQAVLLLPSSCFPMNCACAQTGLLLPALLILTSA